MSLKINKPQAFFNQWVIIDHTKNILIVVKPISIMLRGRVFNESFECVTDRKWDCDLWEMTL